MLTSSPAVRRPVLALVLCVAGVLAGAGLAGCGVGVPPSSAPPQPPAATAVPGVNADAPDHSVAVRDLYLPDPGAAGYPAGASAPVAVQVWNNTSRPISLTRATASNLPAILVLAGATPAAADSTAFDLPIPADSSVVLTQQTGRFLLIRCVPVKLAAGASVPMTFTFSNGTSIAIAAPVGLVASVAAPLPADSPGAC